MNRLEKTEKYLKNLWYNKNKLIRVLVYNVTYWFFLAIFTFIVALVSSFLGETEGIIVGMFLFISSVFSIMYLLPEEKKN